MADNQGSFVTGLSLGLFAGAASFFLLLTPEGKKLRRRLEEEWQAAQAAGAVKLPSETPNTVSVRSLFGSLRQAIAEAAATAEPATSNVKKSKKPPSKHRLPRFKGV